MGINGSRYRESSSRYEPCPPCPKLPNPDPFNYKVLEAKTIKNFLIVKINYPDCNNYEGNKILVFDNAKLEDFINAKSIDPHFSNSKVGVHPIARFTPTKDGMDMAIQFCTYYQSQSERQAERY